MTVVGVGIGRRGGMAVGMVVEGVVEQIVVEMEEVESG